MRCPVSAKLTQVEMPLHIKKREGSESSLDSQPSHSPHHTDPAHSSDDIATDSQVSDPPQRTRREKYTVKYGTAPIGHTGNDDQRIVGILRGTSGRKRFKLLIILTRVITIGRDRNCDLVLHQPEISQYHVRLNAVRTSTSITLPIIHDTSSNGYILNGVWQNPKAQTILNGKPIFRRALVLQDGDEISFPGDGNAVFRYEHNSSSHGLGATSGQNLLSQAPLIPHWNRYPVKLGEWAVLETILGDGTHAIVHLGIHCASGAQVAIKTTKRQDTDDLDIKVAWDRELNLISSMSHPNVIGLLDHIEDETRISDHLVMSLVLGGDLFAYLEKHIDLTEKEVAFIAWQLCQGLGYLHNRDIAHRDIKPENVLLQVSCAYPRLMIGDLGDASTYHTLQATIGDKARPVSRADELYGTLEYTSPEKTKAYILACRGSSEGLEQYDGSERGRRRIVRKWLVEDQRADMWSLGSVLWRCITNLHYDALVDVLCIDDRQGAAGRIEFEDGSDTRGETQSSCDDSLQADDSMGDDSHRQPGLRVLRRRYSGSDRETEEITNSQSEHDGEELGRGSFPSEMAYQLRNTGTQDEEALRSATPDNEAEPENLRIFKFEDTQNADRQYRNHVVLDYDALMTARDRETLLEKTKLFKVRVNGLQRSGEKSAMQKLILQMADPKDLMCMSRWRDFSPQAWSFVFHGLLAWDPEERMTVDQAKEHEWLMARQLDLETLYERVVVRGLVAEGIEW